MSETNTEMSLTSSQFSCFFPSDDIDKIMKDFSNIIDKHPLSQKEKEKNDSLNNIIGLFQAENTCINLDEEDEDILPYFKIKKKIFKVIYKNKVSLFTEPINSLKNEFIDEKKLKKKAHSSKKKPRFTYRDNIRRKIKRRFLNTNLIQALNNVLKKEGYAIYFKKFAQKFAGNITKEKDKMILEKSLFEIFQMEELYKDKKDSLSENYKHNLKIITQIKEDENSELNKILNKKYRRIYEEYIHSEEFIIEIERLKNKEKKEEEYIERYKYFAKHLIEFCS